MDVTVNGEPVHLPAGTTVAALIAGMGLEPRGVAVAVDEEVVPRSTWDVAALRDGHRVEVLAVAQGGC